MTALPASNEQQQPDEPLGVNSAFVRDLDALLRQRRDVRRFLNKPVDEDNNIHEVVLTITVDAKEGDSTLFLVEVQQAGLFMIEGYTEEEFGAIVGSFCPNILFPYARETIANTVSKGGFPEFVLQPINFDALYMQSRQQAAQQEAEASEKH